MKPGFDPVQIEQIDALIAPGRYPPRWGWHDDHRCLDQTADYLPALMQVRSEFAALLDQINAVPRGSALQLGMGNCRASHDVWSAIFDKVVTIDFGVVANGGTELAGLDTHSPAARSLAESCGPLDFLFIDAGHSYDDVAADHRDYEPLVKPGGLIAFHDALLRPNYPEVEVWRFLEALEKRAPWIVLAGDEVGTAWYRKPL